jgi:hypothetical protein
LGNEQIGIALGSSKNAFIRKRFAYSRCERSHQQSVRKSVIDFVLQL